MSDSDIAMSEGETAKSDSETESDLLTDTSEVDCNDSDIEIDVVRQKVVVHRIRTQRFLNYCAFGFMCVSQRFFNIGMFDRDKKKFCYKCFFDTVQPFTRNVKSTHTSQHFTGYSADLIDKVSYCYVCNEKLFTYYLTKFCFKCMNS